MDAAQLRARNRFDLILASGLGVTLELPNMLDCMIAAEVPMPVIRHLDRLAKEREKANQNGGPEDSLMDHLEMDELGAMRRANVEAMRRAVKALDGEELSEPLSSEDISGFTPDEQAELISYIQREAVPPTPPTP